MCGQTKVKIYEKTRVRVNAGEVTGHGTELFSYFYKPFNSSKVLRTAIEKFMEGVARYECVYHRNSKDFKEKNKRKLLENIGEKFNLSAAEAEVKFRNI